MNVESALVGLPHLYVAQKRGASFIPLVYCGMRHMPCRNRPQAPASYDPGIWSPQYFSPDLALPAFDYFFVRSPPPGQPIFGQQWHNLKLVAQRGTWLLYQRTTPPSQP
jgi:hypothetical protein